MAIYRPEFSFDADFTMIPNAWVRDPKLTRKARGLLVELVSHKPGYRQSIEQLSTNGLERRGAVISAIRELEFYGYLTRTRVRDAAGRFGEQDYIVSEPPPTADNPPMDDATPKKTNSKKTRQTEEGESELRPHARHVSPAVRFASTDGTVTAGQKAHLRDLHIHRHAEVPTAEDEAWISSLSRTGARYEIDAQLLDMPRYPDYEGPKLGMPAYEALSAKGKLWADRGMLPEEKPVESWF